jgi:hypothetical protein
MIDYTAETGLPLGPRSKTRRGGRKNRGPEHHLKNLQQAMKAGDHGSAKSHALSLANALHKGVAKPGSAVPDEPDTQDTAGPVNQPLSVGLPGATQPSQPSNLTKLAAILRGKS